MKTVTSIDAQNHLTPPIPLVATADLFRNDCVLAEGVNPFMGGFLPACACFLHVVLHFRSQHVDEHLPTPPSLVADL